MIKSIVQCTTVSLPSLRSKGSKVLSGLPQLVADMEAKQTAFTDTVANEVQPQTGSGGDSGASEGTMVAACGRRGGRDGGRSRPSRRVQGEGRSRKRRAAALYT